MLALTLLTYICYAFIAAIFIRVAFSWIGPNPRNSLFRFCYQITEPVLAPVRRLLPQSMGIDLSPMIVMLAIWLLLGLLRP